MASGSVPQTLCGPGEQGRWGAAGKASLAISIHSVSTSDFQMVTTNGEPLSLVQGQGSPKNGRLTSSLGSQVGLV